MAWGISRAPTPGLALDRWGLPVHCTLLLPMVARMSLSDWSQDDIPKMAASTNLVPSGHQPCCQPCYQPCCQSCALVLYQLVPTRTDGTRPSNKNEMVPATTWYQVVTFCYQMLPSVTNWCMDFSNSVYAGASYTDIVNPPLPWGSGYRCP